MRKTESLIRLPKHLKEYLAKIAETYGVSQSQYVERLLEADWAVQEKKGVLIDE